MKTAVIGSRNITDYSRIEAGLKGLNISKIISGGAAGVDTMAATYAKENGIEAEIIRPDYGKFGAKAAPIIRNKEIVNKADIVVAFWDGKSKGTAFVIDYATKQGKRVIVL